MTWFKVGDELTFHPRVLRAGNGAMGLWLRAGTWCSEHLTEGWISHEDARALGSAAEVKKLVTVGLWYEEPREGIAGYQFHRWATNGLGDKRQPTRAEVEAEREANRQRQQRYRDRKKAGAPPQEEPPAVSSGDGGVTRNATGDSGVSNGSPDPTRPTTPPAEESAPAKPASPRRGATRIPEPFLLTRDMRQWVLDEGLNLIDVEAETREFVDFWRAATRDAMKRDWVSTWRNRMRQQQKHLETQAPAAPATKSIRERYAERGL